MKKPRKPVCKAQTTRYEEWENDKHTLDILKALIRQSRNEPDNPMTLSPGEEYAIRRAIRIIKGRRTPEPDSPQTAHVGYEPGERGRGVERDATYEEEE